MLPWAGIISIRAPLLQFESLRCSLKPGILLPRSPDVLGEQFSGRNSPHDAFGGRGAGGWRLAQPCLVKSRVKKRVFLRPCFCTGRRGAIAEAEVQSCSVGDSSAGPKGNLQHKPQNRWEAAMRQHSRFCSCGSGVNLNKLFYIYKSCRVAYGSEDWPQRQSSQSRQASGTLPDPVLERLH